MFGRSGGWAVGKALDPRFSNAIEKLMGTVSGEVLALARIYEHAHVCPRRSIR